MSRFSASDIFGRDADSIVAGEAFTACDR
jgi:hypothetical protein